MAKENLIYNSLRLNVNNPRHQKINQVLQKLNRTVYKSKNQFIADALEFYINHYGQEHFIEKEEEAEPFVRRGEFEELQNRMIDKAVNEARNEVIRVLGGVISGMGNLTVKTTGKDMNDAEEEVDEVMTGLAAGRMEG